MKYLPSCILFILFVSFATGNSIIKLTSANFDTITHLENPTSDWFIVFHATDCKYYRALEPKLSLLAATLPETLQIGSVDGIMSPDLKKRFDVRRTPTLFFFHKGRMYPYKGEQTVEYMNEYAQGLFLEIDAANPNFKRFFPIPPSERANLTKAVENRKTSAGENSESITVVHDSMKSEL
ncbi:hypothetical protein THRCLA_09924 [Thraustotheca clavata]|uniref:Thioredoxin domain-containing protein n=1 Tax=Thraustotheca clavata TaxID=74557 RepID=A0A1V9YTG7_9STRA|nr:hypothetical protein THRCLA_09924 [Thraustotheca clavata]